MNNKSTKRKTHSMVLPTHDLEASKSRRWRNRMMPWIMMGTLLIFPFGVKSERMDFSALQLNGDTTTFHTKINQKQERVLRLTPAKNNQIGSAFTKNRINMAAGFSTLFTFRITEPCIKDVGGDGIVFVVQSKQPNILAEAHSDIGYANMPKSVGVEFDTWDNGGWRNDSDGNHVGININGHFNGPTAGVEPSFNDGTIWYAWIDYDGKQLEVRANQTGQRPKVPLLARSLNLKQRLGGTDAFVGFTSSTGGDCNNHDIVSWTLVSQTATLTFSVPKKPSINADIAFVVDQSHSHKDDIVAFQTKVEPIVNVFDKFGDSVYYALVGFIDYPAPPYGSIYGKAEKQPSCLHPKWPDDKKTGDFPYCLYQVLTDDKKSFVSKINKLSTYKGGDNLESQLDAIYQTVNELKWRDDSLRIILLATDANFHDSEMKLDSPDKREREKEFSYPGHGYSETLKALQNKNVVLYGLGGTGRMDDLSQLSEDSGGKAYRLPTSKHEIKDHIGNVWDDLKNYGYLVLKADNPLYVESIKPQKIDLAGLSAGDDIQFTVTFKPEALQKLEQVEFTLQTDKEVFLAKQSVLLRGD